MNKSTRLISMAKFNEISPLNNPFYYNMYVAFINCQARVIAILSSLSSIKGTSVCVVENLN